MEERNQPTHSLLYIWREKEEVGGGTRITWRDERIEGGGRGVGGGWGAVGGGGEFISLKA